MVVQRHGLSRGGWIFARQGGLPPDLHGVAAIAAGYTHSMALVDDGPPRMIQQPLDVAGTFGGNARLVANAFGASPLRYQWHINGVPLIGATNATLALDGVSFFDEAEDYAIHGSNRARLRHESSRDRYRECQQTLQREPPDRAGDWRGVTGRQRVAVRPRAGHRTFYLRVVARWPADSDSREETLPARQHSVRGRG